LHHPLWRQGATAADQSCARSANEERSHRSVPRGQNPASAFPGRRNEVMKTNDENRRPVWGYAVTPSEIALSMVNFSELCPCGRGSRYKSGSCPLWIKSARKNLHFDVCFTAKADICATTRSDVGIRTPINGSAVSQLRSRHKSKRDIQRFAHNGRPDPMAR
jgi:hypothetical protein